MKEKINISGIEDDLVISANENKNIFSNKLLNQKKIAISINALNPYLPFVDNFKLSPRFFFNYCVLISFLSNPH